MTSSAEIPELFLAMWSGGMAGATALIGWWRIVRPGFFRLMGGIVGTLSLAAWWAGAEPTMLVAGVGGAVVAFAGTQWRLAVAGALISCGAALVAAASGGWLLAVAGSLALGAVTAEMLLGHWFLVDPRLPRRSLITLAVAGLVGTCLDAALVLVDASFEGLSLAVFLVLALTTAGLMLMAALALREPGYSGVMAATGLSYLAVLTVIGTVTLGRLAITGTVLSFG